MLPRPPPLALLVLCLALPAGAQPPADEAGELEAMEAAELAELGAAAWAGPDPGEHSAIEGLHRRLRRLGLRAEGLAFELGSGGFDAGHGRPGGAAEGQARARLAGFDIPVVINPAVEQYLGLLQGRGRAMFARWLARTSRYYPLMRPILRRHGLPEDLVAVALIESGLKYSAVSSAQAVGPWQFVERTARAYGLKMDFWLDERRDFLKATDAAARHLKDLHERFGDWYLAWAAYNTGETRVASGLRRAGVSDYWGLRESEHLAAETKRYVPKIIAAALITKNPERFGFAEIDWQRPLVFEEVEVSGPVNLKAAARAVGVELEAIQELNPELRYWCSPPYLDRYRLRVPRGAAGRFHVRYRPLAGDQQIAHTRHRLQPGETLSHLAARYGTSTQALLQANRIQDPRRIRAGTSLLIPVRPCGGPAPRPAARAPAAPRPASAADAGGAFYAVQAGDSLWRIAAEHGTTVEVLVRLNRIEPGAVLSIGTRLRLPRSTP